LTHAQLLACCGSEAWVRRMLSCQPFATAAATHQAADEVWWSLTADDWLEAFSKHPKIGQKSDAKWSEQEQLGMQQAARQTAEQMASLNADYADRFGFIFIVCATGKGADEMLQLLQDRLLHSRAEEIRIAAAEQAKIIHLRLDKLQAE
jgi:2-oxo-4-hydroxy-4-carboxy-5-ureidoimidazoline decarboxylase